MAKRPERRASRKSIDEGALSKGQLRKLNALRKSLGENIANRAFAEWLSKQDAGAATAVDKNAEHIMAALEPLIAGGRLTIPRGGYLLQRGRGRIILTRARSG